MNFKQAFLPVLVAGFLFPGGAALAQARITQENGSVTVKTATDTLRLTVCSPTLIHVVASPDDSAEAATPKQPWLIQRCTPHKFTLTMPPAQTTPSQKTTSCGTRRWPRLTPARSK